MRTPKHSVIFSNKMFQRGLIVYGIQDKIELNQRTFYILVILMNPKYPIYIISIGRWESRLTTKIFEKRNIPYRIVVEPSEYEQYACVINKEKILTLSS